jgi:hypothetical protein
MCELSLQPLDVIGKSWTDKRHVNHSAKRNVKPGFLHWRNPHALDALNRVHLLHFTKLILIELQEGFILLFITDIHWRSGLGGALPRRLWL